VPEAERERPDDRSRGMTPSTSPLVTFIGAIEVAERVHSLAIGPVHVRKQIVDKTHARRPGRTRHSVFAIGCRPELYVPSQLAAASDRP
jgi:hypothetical protein